MKKIEDFNIEDYEVIMSVESDIPKIMTNLEMDLECRSKAVSEHGYYEQYICTTKIKAEQETCDKINMLMNDKFKSIQDITFEIVNDIYESQNILNDMFELELKLDILIIELTTLHLALNDKDFTFLELVISTRNILKIKSNILTTSYKLDKKQSNSNSEKTIKVKFKKDLGLYLYIQKVVGLLPDNNSEIGKIWAEIYGANDVFSDKIRQCITPEKDYKKR